MKYKHIIFDIDGTLINSEEALLLSLQDTLKELQQKYYELSDLRFCLGIPGETVLRKLGFNNTSEANSIWNTNLVKHSDSVRLFPDVEELIKNLFIKGFKLGLITSKTRLEYNQDFVPFGIERFFTRAICAEDSEDHKPTPYPMLKYLEKEKITNKQAIYIGDTAYDMQCAKGADVDFGLALWGCTDPDHIEADYRFNQPMDVIPVLGVL